MRLLAWLMLALCVMAPVAHADDFSIIAAEAAYGDIALQIAGPQADLTQIMRDPNANPHRFIADPALAKQVASADLVIQNGLGYDPWMTTLLAGSGDADRRVITVASLLHRKPGDNPHLWYDPAAVALLAQAIADELKTHDPDDDKALRNRLRLFLASLKPLQAKVSAMRSKWTGTPVAATEPVFGPMADALGLSMHGASFQAAVMAGTPPNAADAATLETELRQHQVRALIYNPQVTDAASQHLLDVARTAGIPVVTVRETRPRGKTYQDWMMGTLSALDHALSSGAS
ncbi:metal ABC transporter solute-binding protein, Zn/Mn family [Acidisoma sp. L85]|jgi:zinc/manganese transport system substrate-binding protein|uniref:metal ABC transporter solute-binding protein, Zn/Mn family n=2 Tax=unclassified Acidisoma TaxID=2634065 RepID=UPI001C20B19C|nr:zinc ABC transporter substrate-binding protein [Acidisoma sp. L85]